MDLERKTQEEKREGIFIRKMFEVIIIPRSTFESVCQKPRVFLAMIIVLSIQLIYSLISLPKVTEHALYMAQNLPNYQPSMAGFVKTMAEISGTVGPIFGPTILWLVMAGLLMLTTTLTGDSGKFEGIFLVNVFAYIPKLIEGFVTTIIRQLIDINSFANVQSNWASCVLVLPNPSDPTKPGVLYTFLSQFDLFTIWSLILITIGAGVVFKISNKKSAIMVFGIFLALVLIITGFYALTHK